MKGENSRLAYGRKVITDMSPEEREKREREARADREKLRREQAAKRAER